MILELKDYRIFLGADIWKDFAYLLKQRAYSQILILADENTARDCLPIFQVWVDAPFRVIEIPAGERYKTLQTCQAIWKTMFEYAADRNALVINLGGGVIGDMGGFCAGTYKRGVDFIQFPTTLLSQVDASVGGKLGIDFQGIKNSIGLFMNPQAVFIYPPFLETLSKRELRSGFAEIVKHGLIFDAQYWADIQQLNELTVANLSELVLPSIEIKKEVVESDPYEKGLRKILNFGHTIGHAVESFYLETDTPLLHGEAIAIGMICEAWLSFKTFTLKQSELRLISEFILKIFGKVQLELNQTDAFIQVMRNDKKNENAQINFTLLKRIGEAVVNQTCDEESIAASLRYYDELTGC